MKRKIMPAIIVCLFIAIASLAQTSDAEAVAMANLLGVQKREIVAKLVPVNGKDSVAFWKIYDQYLEKNKTTGKERIQLYEQTANSYATMTPQLADSFARRQFVVRREQEQTLEEYYKKVKDGTNAVVAFEFYQAETYLLTQIRATIMQQIPTYGEFQSMIKK